eukprot:CAMPEP_0119005330 /NCGR_PEP_ID=MMETSP1176-20130426/1653_1 /TAXON_ID=265551 /ORGANISM="Synedropsis recta cf, Strain CCMP1620" /LENGTH=837 /DNA_ID=CAMNT_0006957119 /DNA_START=130 /DNA_END=2643 /DNA_ORIENTATION=+
MRCFLLSLLLSAVTVTVTVTTVTAQSDSSSSVLSTPFNPSFQSLAHAPCVTLFTREGKQGCGTSSRDVQTGRLQTYSGVEESLGPKEDAPYVALVPEQLLTKEGLQDILANNKQGFLQGILITNTSTTSTTTSTDADAVVEEDAEDADATAVTTVTAVTSSNPYYSPSSRSPNGKRTPSQFLNYGNSAYGWNSNGDALLQLDFKGIPMAYVLDRDVSNALLQEAGGDVVAEFNYYMGPAVSTHGELNSATCLSWKDAVDNVWRPKCLPLGGNSVWATVYVDPQGSQRRERDLKEKEKEKEQSNDEETAETKVDKKKTRQLEDADNADGSVFFLTASMDANSLFHEATPAANEAATNILTLLLAAKLLGSVQFTHTTEIVVALFQTEAFGFVGSRRFLKDISSFACQSDPVASVAKNKTTEQACLNPLRPSLEFTKILDPNADGTNSRSILGMLSVDQLGVLTTDQNLYIHSDGSDYGNFLSEVLQAVPGNGYTISEVEPEADDDHFDGDDVTLPPTPLTSLLSLGTGGGGAVLTGYANTFNPTAHYGSHRDSVSYQTMNLEAIATAATTLARTAIAAAYDGGQLDSDTASAYALTILPDSLAADDATLVELADCLYVNGNCPLLLKYAKVEAATESKKTGFSIGTGNALGNPPNYYTDVFNGANGQPFVKVGDRTYGNYDGTDDYGKNSADAFGVQPSLLENAVRGLLNDYLGRPVSAALKSCKKTSDCANVEYCDEQAAVCTGGRQCVCRQAHFHIALDEALVATNVTGYFQVSDDDEGLSALYTEPYWSSTVGVKVYRDSDAGSTVAILLGTFVLGASIAATFVMKRTMRKEKLY